MIMSDEDIVKEKKGEKDPEQEEDINKADEREQMTDDAEISPREDAFVEGYEKDEEKSMKKKEETSEQMN